MKRLTLLTILLVVVGLTAGFALELKPSFELSGSATLTWGVDLETGYTGFLNEAEADLTLTLLAEDGTAVNSGEGDWYGWIEISDLELFWTDAFGGGGTWNADGLGVSAKIVGLGGALAIGVYDAPDLALDFVTAIESDADDVRDDTESDGVGVDYAGFGTYVSYNISEMLMVGLNVVSENDWTLNSAQAYAFGLDVQVKIAPLTIDAGVNYGFNYASNVLGAGIKVAADLDAIDAWVGFDAQVTGGFAFDVGGGVEATLAEGVTAALDVVYGAAFNDLDIAFVFTEPGDAGLVDGLDASLTVYFLDIADSMEYEVILEAGYKMGKLYPHFGVTYGDPANPTDDPAFLSAFLHCDYDLFEKAPTTLFVEWNDVYFLPSVALGTLTVGVTVSY